MKRIIIFDIFFLLVLFGIRTDVIFSQIETADGFASVDALGLNGTTGGVGGHVVTVTNTGEFVNYIGKTGAYVVQIDGTLQLSEMVNVISNKTLVGVDSNGVITGSGLNLSHVSNIIIRNIRFENILAHLSDDAINIEDESHHIWIDHCEFSNGRDGLIDIKKGSDYVTISWNIFTNHEKTCLLGHDDLNDAQDAGHLRVTYHHNWFNATSVRHPRVRFSALCHVYNNYYRGNQYGVASTMDAEVLVENNYFLRVASPTRVGYVASGVGDLVERSNIYDLCTFGPETRGEVPDPPYTYSLDSASNVPNIVEQGAGRAGFVFVPAEVPAWSVYAADVLPDENDPPFSAAEAINPPDTTSRIIEDPVLSGNWLLRFVNPIQEGSTFLWSRDWHIDDSLGATIAFRIKSVDQSLYDRSGEVTFGDGSFSERFLISSDGTLELGGNGGEAVLSYRPGGWHTFRITFQKGLSNIYLDEEQNPILSGTTLSENSDTHVRFGDGSSEMTSGFLLDWLIFDTTGARGPGESAIPETLIVDAPPIAAQWQIYDASVFPPENDPPFTETNVANPPDTTTWIVDDPDINGNWLMKFIDAAEGVSKSMWGRNWAMDDEVGATFAFRVRPIDRESYGRTFEVEFRDGKQRERFILKSNGTAQLARAGVNQMLPSRLDGWHTFRITYRNGFSTVYLDEETTPLISGSTPSANGYNDVRFGDGSDDDSHGFYLDWFIYDVTGVYAPGESELPEGLFVDEPESTEVSLSRAVIPQALILEQNYPNPFNPVTTIRFRLPRSGLVTIVIYNIYGQAVRTLLCNEKMDPGSHEIEFHAGECPSGIYLYKIESGRFMQVKKMVLVR